MNVAVLAVRLAVVGLLACACAAAAPAPPEPLPLTPALRARLDALANGASGVEPGDAPAVALAFVADGKLVYERAAGYADLAGHVPATVRTRFRIASITKMFTAVSVLQLAERHALSLDEKLSRYLPWAPHADEVTLRELLMHTSGLPNYLDEAFATGKVTAPVTPRALIETLAGAPLDFPPGARYAYSNTGYVLLGLVVEAVAGEPLAEYERRHLFEPAQMGDTSLGAVPAGAPFALGYRDGSGAPAQRFDASWLYAAGDGISTASDLARFDIALMNGVLLGAQAWAQMQAEPVPTGSGDEGYGLGVTVAGFGPLALVGHHGGLPGYESDDEVLPGKRAAIVVLSNALRFRTDYLVSDLLAALFPVTFAAAIADVKAGIVEIAPGENPVVTASLRRSIEALQRAGVDRSLGSLGELQSLIFRGKSTTGELSEYHYVGIFAGGRQPLTLVVQRDGKVAGFWLH
jgi:CubicO group peptidase (beta-lactamase class C family)